MTNFSHSFTFVQLDPRKGAENPNFDLGIEVTVAALLSGQPNIDHHGPDATRDTLSACQQAMTVDLPKDGAVIATVRPDADSMAAMAVLANRAEGRRMNEKLVELIGQRDRFGLVGENQFDQLYVAISRIAADFKKSMSERVGLIQDILEGTHDDVLIEKMWAEREAEFKAAKAGSVVSNWYDGRLAVVHSTHRFATNLGYAISNVVVATNPQMAIMAKNAEGNVVPNGETYRKHTVCMWSEHDLDIKAVLAELSALEPGWGGQGTIIGSPQNISSVLTTDQVVEIVLKHIR